MLHGKWKIIIYNAFVTLRYVYIYLIKILLIDDKIKIFMVNIWFTYSSYMKTLNEYMI